MALTFGPPFRRIGKTRYAMEAEKQYPNMTPIFSAIEDRDEHRALCIEVLWAAKEWRTKGLVIGKRLGEAVDRLMQFEEEHKSAQAS